MHLRWKQRLGPVAIAARLGMAASTVHAVLVRCRLNRLTHVDRATGEPIRRYEHDRPGALLHVDVKKLGNIPDGGGWRYVGRHQGDATGPGHPRPRPQQARNPTSAPAYVHTVLDDHSRVAYAEIHDDETAATATAVLRRAVAWFADPRRHRRAGALRQRLGLPQSRLWRDTCAELGIPDEEDPAPTGRRPTARSNASTAPWPTAGPTGGSTTHEITRRAALPGWLHQYNHHRPTAMGSLPPITRWTNLSGQYNLNQRGPPPRASCTAPLLAGI